MRYFSKNRLVFQNSGTPLGIMLPLTMDKQKKEGIADDELISLGVVGGHISENLIDSGYVLIVYNRIKNGTFLLDAAYSRMRKKLINKGENRLFKKLLSSIGIGSATVDTKLSKAQYAQGETVEGVVEVRGGSVEQRIDEIYLALVTTYIREIDDKKVEEKAVLARYKVSDSMTIGPNETKTIPFQFALPYDVPVTLGSSKVWLQTGLDIKMALDPQDRDYLTIEPHPLVAAFLEAARQLGFRLCDVQCEQAPRYWQRRLPFVQEFEFRPTGGAFRGRLDELEAIFFVSEHGVEAILEIDRKARGFAGLLAEALDMDETLVRFTYGPNDIASLPQLLANAIRRHS